MLLEAISHDGLHLVGEWTARDVVLECIVQANQRITVQIGCRVLVGLLIANHEAQHFPRQVRILGAHRDRHTATAGAHELTFGAGREELDAHLELVADVLERTDDVRRQHVIHGGQTAFEQLDSTRRELGLCGWGRRDLVSPGRAHEVQDLDSGGVVEDALAEVVVEVKGAVALHQWPPTRHPARVPAYPTPLLRPAPGRVLGELASRALEVIPGPFVGRQRHSRLVEYRLVVADEQIRHTDGHRVPLALVVVVALQDLEPVLVVSVDERLLGHVVVERLQRALRGEVQEA